MGPDGNLEGKTVLVTGATSGIGRATAEAFGRRGASVVVTGRDQSRGSEVTAGIGDSSRFIAADLARSAEVRRLIGDVGAVDVLINNAGLVSFAPTHETGEDLIDEAVAVNVKAPFLLAAALAPKMVAGGGGAIVNVSTMVADFGMPGTALYGATKAALGLLTKTWAAEYGPQGVRVNAVSPGPVRTPGAETFGDALDQLAATVPLNRPATSDEIATAIVFLASDAAAYINGAILAIDGGRTAI